MENKKKVKRLREREAACKYEGQKEEKIKKKKEECYSYHELGLLTLSYMSWVRLSGF
jgi:hypothetical protein